MLPNLPTTSDRNYLQQQKHQPLIVQMLQSSVNYSPTSLGSASPDSSVSSLTSPALPSLLARSSFTDFSIDRILAIESKENPMSATNSASCSTNKSNIGRSDHSQMCSNMVAFTFSTCYNQPDSRSPTPPALNSMYSLPVHMPALLDRRRLPRRQRTNFNSLQTTQLENAFARCQYLGLQDRTYLAAQLGLLEPQVKIWFQNRRCKYRRQEWSTSSK